MKEDLTLIEILGLAIKSEEEAALFYTNVAKMIKNDLVRGKYESLAREEVGHKHMLIGLYRKMTGEKEPPCIPTGVDVAEKYSVQFNVDSIEEVLMYAIGREKHANEFYRKAAAKAIDVNSKRTLEYLADIERGHEVLLKSELDAYLRDRDWYAEKPDVQLVGP